MDYKKKYEDALKKAKMYQGITVLPAESIIESIFPELAESEDEKIIKRIIHALHGDVLDMEETTKAISWLEKQGKQKSDDKVEPKFHEGEWVVYKNDICQIVKREEGCNKLVTNFGIKKELVNERNLSTARLWTIQDAKDGDVLASELCDSIILFKGIKDDNIDFYCDYDFSKIDIPGDRFAINNGQHYGNVKDSKDFHPATKEQYDLLFQKMKEAGYMWDAEKKKLSRRVIDEGKTEMDYCFTKMMNGEKVSSAWSEKDEKTWKELIEEVKDQLDSVPAPDCRNKEDEKVLKQLTRWLDWLKSIKYFFKYDI